MRTDDVQQLKQYIELRYLGEISLKELFYLIDSGIYWKSNINFPKEEDYVENSN